MKETWNVAGVRLKERVHEKKKPEKMSGISVQQKKSIPDELIRLENIYGEYRFGINDQKQFVMFMKRKKSQKEEKMLNNDTRQLESSRQKKLRFHDECFLTNSHSRQESALLHLTALKETEAMIYSDFIDAAKELKQDTLNRMMPEAIKEMRPQLIDEMHQQVRQSIRKTLEMAKTRQTDDWLFLKPREDDVLILMEDEGEEV